MLGTLCLTSELGDVLVTDDQERRLFCDRRTNVTSRASSQVCRLSSRDGERASEYCDIAKKWPLAVPFTSDWLIQGRADRALDASKPIIKAEAGVGTSLTEHFASSTRIL